MGNHVQGIQAGGVGIDLSQGWSHPPCLPSSAAPGPARPCPPHYLLAGPRLCPPAVLRQEKEQSEPSVGPGGEATRIPGDVPPVPLVPQKHHQESPGHPAVGIPFPSALPSLPSEHIPPLGPRYAVRPNPRHPGPRTLRQPLQIAGVPKRPGLPGCSEQII